MLPLHPIQDTESAHLPDSLAARLQRVSAVLKVHDTAGDASIIPCSAFKVEFQLLQKSSTESMNANLKEGERWLSQASFDLDAARWLFQGQFWWGEE